MAVYEPGIVVRRGENKDGLGIGSFMVADFLCHFEMMAMKAFMLVIDKRKQQHERQGP